MTRRRQPPSKMAIETVQDTITYTAADRKGVTMICNLQTVLEQYRSDGQNLILKEVKWTFQAAVPDAGIPFIGILPMVVQTAGNITDLVDATGDEVNSLLAAQIDDVFGSAKLSGWQWSRVKAAVFDDPDVIYIAELVGTVSLPQQALQILSKEVSSERLQNLFLVAVHYGSAAMSIQLNSTIQMEFVETRKALVLR